MSKNETSKYEVGIETYDVDGKEMKVAVLLDWYGYEGEDKSDREGMIIDYRYPPDTQEFDVDDYDCIDYEQVAIGNEVEAAEDDDYILFKFNELFS